MKKCRGFLRFNFGGFCWNPPTLLALRHPKVPNPFEKKKKTTKTAKLGSVPFSCISLRVSGPSSSILRGNWTEMSQTSLFFLFLFLGRRQESQKKGKTLKKQEIHAIKTTRNSKKGRTRFRYFIGLWGSEFGSKIWSFLGSC